MMILGFETLTLKVLDSNFLRGDRIKRGPLDYRSPPSGRRERAASRFRRGGALGLGAAARDPQRGRAQPNSSRVRSGSQVPKGPGVVRGQGSGVRGSGRSSVCDARPEIAADRRKRRSLSDHGARTEVRRDHHRRGP